MNNVLLQRKHFYNGPNRTWKAMMFQCPISRILGEMVPLSMSLFTEISEFFVVIRRFFVKMTVKMLILGLKLLT